LNVAHLVRSVHNWVGLLLGLQVLLWMASGAVMSLYDIDLVRGRTNAISEFAPELQARGYASPGGIIARAPWATELTLKFHMGRPVYLASGSGRAALFDADNASPISPLKEADARAVAQRDFIGTGDIARAELLKEAPRECGCKPPVWRVSFDDRLSTRLYVSPQSGEIEARRNSVWRLYDFFWMLHIMDYKEREDFNNPLVKTASITGLIFALTGVYLVILRLAKGQYRVAGRGAAAASLASAQPVSGAGERPPTTDQAT
jgi:uncharacterized iron-regulated membrane protein